MAHLGFAPPAGSNFYEPDGLPHQETRCLTGAGLKEPSQFADGSSSRTQTLHPVQYSDDDVQAHCEQCCVDPRCLFNTCTECSEQHDDCQQCLEECTDDCTEDPGYVVDCNGSNCAFFGSYFESEPCTEQCQSSEIAECTGCRTQLPLDLPLDSCLYGCQPSRLETTQHGEIKPQNEQSGYGQRVVGISDDQITNTNFDPQYPAAAHGVSYGTSVANLLPYTIESSNQYGMWYPPNKEKTPPPAFITVPSKRKEVKPPATTSVSRPLRSAGITTSKPNISSASLASKHISGSASDTTISPTVATASSEQHTCRWLDDDDQPCNQPFSNPTALHDHLKTFHRVDEHHLCRWQSCHTGIYSRSPHRFTHGTLRHSWGHSGYRPYICKICGRGFAAANVLAEHHANVHLQQKQFSCSECGHMCTSASNLKRHFNEKHAAERFQCEWCARAGRVKCFRRGPNLARHFRRCKFLRRECEEWGEAQAWMRDTKADVDPEWFPPGYMKGKNGMDRSRVVPPHLMGEDFPAPLRRIYDFSG